MSDLDEFLKNLTEEDKQIISQTIRKCYFKYQDSITKGEENLIFELNIKLLIAILISQKLEHYKSR